MQRPYIQTCPNQPLSGYMMRFVRLLMMACLVVVGVVLLGWRWPVAIAQSNCSPAYPDVCIPPPPPDLDCGDISHRNFRVLAADPHRFDGDKDGIGCEQS